MAIEPKNRALFERLGLAVVRMDLPLGSIITEGRDREQALEWIGEQEAIHRWRESFRFWSILIFTIVAAVAACIAAWPIIKGS